MKVGIIGLGDMGKLYAKKIHENGYQVYGCDLPSRYEELKSTLPYIHVLKDGYGVVRICDLIIFSVEAASIEKVVSLYGPSIKVGAVVCGQTSVKYPEIQAFEKYVPQDVHIMSCHSLHGPFVDPKGQPLVVIRHRCDQEPFEQTLKVLASLNSKMVFLTAQEHDIITADTQAVTHVAYLSMGLAWKTQGMFPWLDPSYVGGIENVKTNIALRIYGSKYHVYAGLALMNPYALDQIKMYSSSVSSLFKLMIREEEDEFRQRILNAKSFVFEGYQQDPILLSDAVLDQFALGSIPKSARKPNSHLSLLAMVDSWYNLKIQPYKHLICQTPPFRLLLGITEYLFMNEELLSEAIDAALFNKDIRPDDCEFYAATNAWVQCVSLSSDEAYKKKFEETAQFFKDQIPQAKELSSKLISIITSKS